MPGASPDSRVGQTRRPRETPGAVVLFARRLFARLLPPLAHRALVGGPVRIGDRRVEGRDAAVGLADPEPALAVEHLADQRRGDAVLLELVLHEHRALRRR